MNNALSTSGPSLSRISFSAMLLAAACALSPLALAHGDVVPQTVDTKGLTPVGDKWLEQNPYRANAQAISIGNSAYAQNCARCHGLQAISGGIAPDLRQLDRDCLIQKDEAKKQACFKEMDGYFASSVRKGKVRNGAVYMPPFEGIFSQEAVWAIKSYLESVSSRTLAAK
ncbi:MAG: cytochrome c-550 PedF [Janthinobacterium sp.]|jgi:cytochrome c-550 PedF